MSNENLPSPEHQRALAIVMSRLENLSRRAAARARLQENFRQIRAMLDAKLEEMRQQDEQDVGAIAPYLEARREREGNKLAFTLLHSRQVVILQSRKDPDHVDYDKDQVLAQVGLDHPSGAVHLGPAPVQISKTAAKEWRKATGEVLPGFQFVEGQRRWHLSFDRDACLNPEWVLPEGEEPKALEEGEEDARA